MVKFWKTMGTIGGISTLLLMVGGLNWGLVALGFNLVESIAGVGTVVTKVIYGAVGLSAIYSAYALFVK
jgi:uncharacterized membrane protein YuzA (DUF378 family)